MWNGRCCGRTEIVCLSGGSVKGIEWEPGRRQRNQSLLIPVNTCCRGGAEKGWLWWIFKSRNRGLGNLIDVFFQSPLSHSEKNEKWSGGGHEESIRQFGFVVQKEQQMAFLDHVWTCGVLLRWRVWAGHWEIWRFVLQWIAVTDKSQVRMTFPERVGHEEKRWQRTKPCRNIALIFWFNQRRAQGHLYWFENLILKLHSK